VEAQSSAASASPGTGRAFRGLALVFLLSFVNLVGVIVTATALGGVEPWSRWQFVGMYGVFEAANGLANIISPNVWRLPVAELQTSRRTDVKLAGSAMLLPHWGGLARSVAGLVLIALTAREVGVGPATAGLLPFVLLLAFAILALSAVLAWLGVARPDIDVVQFMVRWGLREKELPPISIGASVLQFLLAIATIPAVKIFPPSVLYQPEIGPSEAALLSTLGVSALFAGLACLLWRGRIEWKAPAEQQREAEEHG
jgi:hypothetical protein